MNLSNSIVLTVVIAKKCLFSSNLQLELSKRAYSSFVRVERAGAQALITNPSIST
ncbi:MAG: hypothetical protein ACYTXT_42695 [Nostoc sp.]